MQRSGIYTIYHEPTGKVYVGSSVDVYRRRDEHWQMLRQGSHHAWRLQALWNTYRGQGFTFKVAEWCSVGDLASREQAWIGSYRRNDLLNTAMVVERDGFQRRYGCCGCHPLFGVALFILFVVFIAAVT